MVEGALRSSWALSIGSANMPVVAKTSSYFNTFKLVVPGVKYEGELRRSRRTAAATHGARRRRANSHQLGKLAPERSLL
jgi:hypothetical protein